MILNYFIIAISIYAIIMLTMSLKYILRTPAFKDFILAGAKSGSFLIMLSLLATIMGGSTTLGLLNMSLTKGPAIFWWLALGSIGLMFNALFFAEKLYKFEAYTMPHVASILMGKEARFLISWVIAISWIGIIAAQFSALAQLFSAFVGFSGTSQFVYIGIALIVIIYTAFGGQFSVLRTDVLQFMLIFIGLLMPCIYMYLPDGTFDTVRSQGLGLFNDTFTQMDLIKLFLLVGINYCIGPDIFSRIFSSKDGKSAKYALFGAAGILFVIATLMAFIGAWLQINAKEGQDVLSIFMQLSMPWWMTYIFIFALMSALLSSVDTCLLTVATIVEHDILQGRNITRLRLFIIILGCLALGIVFVQDQIIILLLSSYAIYVPGIVFPLSVAILNHPKGQIHKGLWLSAVSFGSMCGIISLLTDMDYLPFIGMGGSLFLSIVALKYNKFTSK